MPALCKKVETKLYKYPHGGGDNHRISTMPVRLLLNPFYRVRFSAVDKIIEWESQFFM